MTEIELTIPLQTDLSQAERIIERRRREPDGVCVVEQALRACSTTHTPFLRDEAAHALDGRGRRR